MVMTDPIADFLTRIRNANQANHEVLEVPASNIKKGIAEILKRENFITPLASSVPPVTDTLPPASAANVVLVALTT